jgi:PAS domain S-box-containing protein
MSTPLKILLLEDSPAEAELVRRLLLKEKPDSQFSLALNKKDYMLALEQFCPHIILSDHSLPQFNSTDALFLARQEFPDIPFIMVTGAVSEEFAADIIKLGADDYILKDRLNRLPAAIDAALKRRKAEKEKTEAIQGLIQSEEKYRTLVEQAFDGIIIYSPDLIIRDCNHSACAALGYKQAELKGLNIADLFLKEDLLARPLHFETLIAGKTTLDYRRLKRKDGSYIQMEIGTKIMPDGNLMAIGRDITARKEAEQKIKHSETNLRTIFENTSEGFLLLDREGVVKAFNKNSAEYAFFLKEKEMQLGDRMVDFIEPSRKEMFEGIIAKILTGETVIYDRSHDLEDGKTRWVDFSINPVIENGRVNGVCITGRDVTEKKIIEQQREFDHNNLYALINNTNDMMWSVDRELNLITSNDAFDKMAQHVSGQPLSKGDNILTNRFGKDQLKRFRKYYERAFSGKSFVEIEHTDSPAEFWAEISFYPIRQENEVIGTACFSRDITQRKKAEDQIKKAFTERQLLAERTSAILNTLPANIALLDEKGFIVEVNGAWRNFASENGFTGNSYTIGDNYITIAASARGTEKEDGSKVVHGIKSILSKKLKVFTLEYPCHSPNEERWFRMIATPLLKKGKAGVVVMHINITEQKKGEQALQATLKDLSDYKIALDESAIVSITDQHGAISYVNGNFCKISKYKDKELLGKDHKIINSGFHDKAFFKNLWATISGGDIWRSEVKNKARDGSFYWVDTTIVPFLNNKGKPFQYVAINKDLTEKKLLEQEIQEQKIQEHKKIIRAMLKAQEKERNHIGQELHDNINQILASTKLYLGMAGYKNEQLKELVKYPMEMIDNSIAEIRLLSSRYVTPEKNIHLVDLIQTLMDNLQANAGITAVFRCNADNDAMDDDLKLNIYRIIQEQVNNIVKHAGAKKVSVSITTGKHEIIIEINDDGKGFNLKDKRKGIGISNMTSRIESFNGKILINSSPGNGCKICATIPY